MAIILASQSPRRRELMELVGLPFTVQVAQVEETLLPGLTPSEQAERLSQIKAQAIPRGPEDAVIGADTIVVYKNRILGKPRDEAQAREMLTLLSGKTHRVITGLTVLKGENCYSCCEVTEVTFRELSEMEISAYVATGEPMDKAGAYGIQGGAARFVRHIAGDYFNVVGLPVCRLSQILEEIQ